MASKVVIVGVGLIGGSLARALKAAGYCSEIVGCGRPGEWLQEALDLQVIDRCEHDIGHAVRDADMVVVAVPLGAMAGVFGAMVGQLPSTAVLTDVGSAKASVVAAARAAFGDLPANFVPGHPIAGTEHSGVAASFAELFNQRRVIITPTEASAPSAIARVRALWEAAGAQVDEMSIVHHDEVLAATSHLPHLLAYGLVDTLVAMDSSEEIFRFAAGGFRDFTRIASSDPLMWRDIFLANRAAVLQVLDLFTADLQKLRSAIEQGDGEQIIATLRCAKSARDRFSLNFKDNNYNNNNS